jgi:ubiquinone/menaquinone biosynthesis C-methylase UbiE
MNINDSIVKDHWSRVNCSASENNYYYFPPMRSRSCKLIFGETDSNRKDWCEYWTVETYFKNRIPFEKALSICCGFGHVERSLSKLNVANKIIGTDIAPGAIEEAIRMAKENHINNIEYYVSDLNKNAMGNNEYDLIWANGALHHIKDLKFVISNIYNALKPGGYLVSNEYVGPNYQQIGKRQEEIIRAVISLLPNNMKRNCKYHIDYSDKSLTNLIKSFAKAILNKIETCKGNKTVWSKPTIEYFLKTDPSECINSSRIIPILKNTFDDVNVRYFNGSILFYALESEFYANYDFNNIKHKMLLELLFNIEDTFIDMGELIPDNAHIICSKY